MDQKVNFKILFTCGVLNVLSTSFVSSNALVKLFPQNSYLVPLYLMPILLLLCFFLPKGKTSLLKIVMKKPVWRYIMISYHITYTCILLALGIQLITTYFYLETSYVLLIILIAFVCCHLARLGTTSIFNIFFYTMIALVGMNLLILFNTTPREFHLILPLNLGIPKPYLALIPIAMYLDGLYYFFLIDEKKPAMNQKTMIFTTLIVTVISALMILENYLFVDYNILQHIRFPVQFRYRLYHGNKYIEHFDLILLFNAIVMLIAKVVMHINFNRILLKAKKKEIFFTIYAILISAITFLIVRYGFLYLNFLIIACLTLSVLILFIYVFVVYYGREKMKR